MQQELCSGHCLWLRISTTPIISVNTTDSGTEVSQGNFWMKKREKFYSDWHAPKYNIFTEWWQDASPKKGIYKPKACEEIVFIRFCYCCQYYLLSANWRLVNTYLYRCCLHVTQTADICILFRELYSKLRK